MKAKIEFKKLYEDSKLPAKAHKSDAGFDLYAHSVYKWTNNALNEITGSDNWSLSLNHGERVLVKVGIGMSMPTGYEAQIRPRSGNALKNGITVVNSPGTIDSNFRNELGVILLNTDINPFMFKKYDRIAQLIINKLPDIEVVEVEELGTPDERGMAGFGSSGK